MASSRCPRQWHQHQGGAGRILVLGVILAADQTLDQEHVVDVPRSRSRPRLGMEPLGKMDLVIPKARTSGMAHHFPRRPIRPWRIGLKPREWGGRYSK